MNIGLVAHDSKKKLMQNFCIAYRGILSKNNLYATGTTGRLIEEVANLSVHKYLAGHLGGIQQLGAQIEHNDIDLVIFLRDPLKPKPHEPEVNSIFRICDEHNIPLATNLATAELLILSLDRGDLDWREMYSKQRIKRLLCLTCIAAVFMTGCGTKIENAYDTYSTDYINGYNGSNFFASNLCVTNDVNFGQDNMQFAKTAEGAGAFNIDTHQVLYSQNLFEKLYPASTTKILTAYIILKNCDLNATVTVSHDAANPGHSSSVCGLKEGDVITVQDLLYGLLLESGNDAAIALAEYCSGSVEEFAKLMNSTAKSFGATNSSFVNPSGLPDENHYTTIYDMYLIFSNAISLESFVAIISSQTHDAAYTNAQGAAVSKTFKNTCGYLTGAYTAPENVTVTGGKTGTTGEAGHCLVLLSQNAKNERIISIVYKADGKKDLYSFMNEILSGFAN